MLTKFRGALLLAILFYGGTGFAQSSTPVDLQERVDSIFANFGQKPSPGCALAVVQDGKIIYQRGYGMANLDHDIPITPESVFYIASDSKQFTGFSIALLVEQGKLSLDDRISKYFPELPSSVYGQITVDQLVHHTSGIREYWTLWKLRGGREEGPLTQDSFLALMARQKALNFTPGDQFMYTNSGYVLLGMLVKRVSGKSLAEFAAENIFQPLKMDHTRFSPDHTVINTNRATGYGFRDGENKIDFTSLEPSGDGGLMTTVGDLFLWDQNFYHNKLGTGSQQLIELVQTPGMATDGKKLTYGFGLGLFDYKGLAAVGHSGAFGGYKSYMIRLPKQKFSVLCLCNSDAHSMAPWNLGKKVVDIYLADQLKSEPSAASAPPSQSDPNHTGSDATIKMSDQELAAYEGTFREEDGTIWKLSASEGKLLAVVQDATFQLVPLNRTHFKAIGAPQSVDLHFPSGRSPKDGTIELQIGSQPRSSLTPIVVVSASQLSEYVGIFYSDELDSAYKTYVADGKLYVKSRDIDPELLEPLSKDEFKLGDNTLKFERDPSGKTSGFLLNAEGAKSLGFARTVWDSTHP